MTTDQTRFDSDPEALAWARAKAQAYIDQLADWERQADEREAAAKARGIAVARLLAERRLIGGRGCTIGAFDERRPELAGVLAASDATAAVFAPVQPPTRADERRRQIIAAIKASPFEELRTVDYSPNGPLQITVKVDDLADTLLRRMAGEEQPAGEALPPPEGPEYTPCACDHIEPEHEPNAGACRSCDCDAYRATPPAPLRRSEDDCPGFPEHCPNLRSVDPNPPVHYGGIRCGCADGAAT